MIKLSVLSISRLAYILLVCLLLVAYAAPTLALTESERDSLFTPFYDPNSSGCSLGATLLAGSDNPEKIWFYLLSKGLTPPQIAGIMGNLQSESAGTWDPRVVEFGFPNSDGVISKPGDPSTWDDEVPPNVKENGQPGYGIVQWTSPNRKQGLADLATERGVIAGDLGVQMDYLWQELTTSYRASTLEPIQATNDYIVATDIFLEKFENPAHIERTRPVRRAQALALLERFGSSTVTEAGSSGTIVSSCSESSSAPLDTAGCPTEPVPESEIVDAAGFKVHPCIADEVVRIVELAKSQGITLGGWGYRSNQRQIELRRQNCGSSDYAIYEMPSRECSPPTAVPGRSNHEKGTAIDFTCNGQGTIQSRSSICFVFLKENTSLQNLPAEPWHWSHNGQ